ncbi:hypothetical protein HBI81_142060 [Parastagonospora nodorum]|nr:hypothetical protein HBH53_157600 [Parastagonospora nodorum]KAH3995079.1 hypothetical protein HBI10_175640 [Parastagonospora nodorum]KAH4017523.1 hypothetical protein HBI13_141170 [Parastagonospora nodorum]KAH4161067.1 hypothetical protein HBH43_174920 [Parastagonospora nodorum]KAH4292323.1 hypothetical protein HBI01_179960 [Parastagonospora nodorum]
MESSWMSMEQIEINILLNTRLRHLYKLSFVTRSCKLEHIPTQAKNQPTASLRIFIIFISIYPHTSILHHYANSYLPCIPFTCHVSHFSYIHHTCINSNRSILKLVQGRRTDAVAFMALFEKEKALYVRRCLSECDDRTAT